MDPLSFTVAAAQLLGAVNTVIVIVAKYNEEMNKTPRDLLRFVEELRGLRHVLESLESLVLEAKKSDISTDPKIHALVPLYEPLTLYLDDIKSLQLKLEVPSWHMTSRRRRSVVAALGWPLRDDDARRELEKMKAFREQLKDAMQVDTLHVAVANQKILAENQRILTDLVKSWRAKETTDHRRELHRWLGAPDPTANYQAALKKRNDATGLWLTESKLFGEWMDNPRSFIWLYGFAGCGKTILTTTAIEYTARVSQSRVGRAVAYFYFDFNDKEKQCPEKMIRSILKQLSLQCPETPHHLSLLFSSCEDADREPSIDELLSSLQNIFRSFYDVYIIVDALDECSEPEELLDYMDRIRSWRFDHVHMLVSSRPERMLEETIKDMTSPANRVKIQSSLIEDDLRTYIKGRLETDVKLKRWNKSPDVKNDIEKKLMQKADGMFRLVACQLDELASCLNRPQLQQRLRELPKTLDTMYAKMLSSIPEDHEEAAVKILRWLTYAARPLSTEEVAEALCVDADNDPRFDPDYRYPDPRDILEICPSLVVATETNADDTLGDGQIPREQMQLAHYSVKEFLVSKSIQKLAPNFSVKEADANTSIAESCLAYLLSFDKEDDMVPGFLEDFPLADYAARYWIQHAKAAETHERVIGLIMELLDDDNPAYANWTYIFNPDRPWDSPASSGAYRTGREASIPHPPPPPLYIASLTGLAEATRRLLSALGDPAATLNAAAAAGDYGSPLQAASHGGHERVVGLLLAAGADPDFQSGLYGTALQAACFQGHGGVVQLLLAAGADMNKAGGKYANPLHAAAREGHLPIVERLLAAGADVGARGGFYGFPLQGAAFYGHEKVVRALLKGGADVNQKTGGVYGTALQAASRNGSDGVVGMLLEAGAQANDFSGMYHSALQSAARGAQTGVIKKLLAAGADVNARGGKYGSALQAACLVDDGRTVQQLLDAGANVDDVGGKYGTALQTACSEGFEEVVEILLRNGADPNLRGGLHGTPVVAAARKGHDKIVKRLLDAGADAKGLAIAMSPGHKRVIQLLRDAGADITVVPEGSAPEFTVPIYDGGGSTSRSGELLSPATDEASDVAVDIERAAETIKFCDECSKPIPDGARYYHCSICLNDDWDSCEDCINHGFPCRDRKHKMTPRRIKNGIIIDIV